MSKINNKRIVKNTRLGGEYIEIDHATGLKIKLFPMPGYSSAFALFGTKYGSVDVTFKTANDQDFITVPNGIAHYLEHKLFESEECDAFSLFAKTGANCNAFTSFDATAYLFGCSQKFEENLEILLKFVQEPYFTDENVAKEQGIIGQEIRMYDDDPGWRVFFNGLQGIFHSNPVRIDIAGTVQSIAEINKDLLYRCYNTFYNPRNMVLSIAGNFDPDTVVDLCDKLVKEAPDLKLETIIPEEPDDVKEKYVSQKLEVAMPLASLGFKINGVSDSESPKLYVLYNMLMETLLGHTSSFYTDAVKSRLISESNYRVGVFNARGAFVLTAEFEADDPKKVRDELIKTLEAAKLNGIPEAEWNNVRKQTYGEFVKQFGSVQSVALAMLEAAFKDGGAFDLAETAADATIGQMTELLGRINTDYATLSVIEPIDKPTD